MITLCGFGVSNYYNKLKLILLEKEVPFRERLVYPWQRDSFRRSSPLGKIPFVETERGDLSESQVILEYLEELYSDKPMYPKDIFARAKCRELVQHLELNTEWVARRLYKEAFFAALFPRKQSGKPMTDLNLGWKPWRFCQNFRLTSLEPHSQRRTVSPTYIL
jgi:glutathione S-transferase